MIRRPPRSTRTYTPFSYTTLVRAFLPNSANPGGRLDPYTFVGKAGWDRYNGRSLQGGGSITHRFSDNIRLSVKARFIDSDLEYFTHYADSYTYPTDPFSVYGTDGRTIGLYAEASNARMNVFSTDNNLQFNFNTGANVEHVLLVDRKRTRLNSSQYCAAPM